MDSAQIGANLEALAPKYRKLEVSFGALYFILWFPIAFAVWVPLNALSEWHAGLLPAAEVKLTMMPIFWAIPAFFMSLMISAVPVAWIEKRLLGLKKDRYNYTDIRTIRTAPKLIAPNGNVVSRREFVVTFTDGSLLSTGSIPQDLSEADKHSLMATISSNSGYKIQEVGILRNGEW